MPEIRRQPLDEEPLSFTPKDQANAVSLGLIIGILLMLLSFYLDHAGLVLHAVLLYGGAIITFLSGFRLRQAAGGTKPFTGRRVGS